MRCATGGYKKRCPPIDPGWGVDHIGGTLGGKVVVSTIEAAQDIKDSPGCSPDTEVYAQINQPALNAARKAETSKKSQVPSPVKSAWGS